MTHLTPYRLRTLLFAAALVVAAPCALAQQPPDINRSLAALADQPASHTSFSFDRTMLQVAQNLLASGGMDANHAAAAITGISVDNYRYAQRAFYTPESMTSIIAAYHAAGSTPDELGVAAAIAKAYCSEAYFHVAAETIQVHGGIGFTWEHDAHLYFRRAKSSQLFLGDEHYHRERFAALTGI